MPETQTVDEVVSTRSGSRQGGLSSRPTEGEVVTASTGTVKVDRGGVEDETHGSARRGRVFSKSVEDRLAKFEKGTQDARPPAAHEEGDADEGEAGEADDVGNEEAGDDAVGDDAAASNDGGEEGEGEGTEAEPDPAAEWQTANARLEARNRELISELETARQTPKSQRTERETALVTAEAAYIDEGSVPALRKFLSVVTGAAPDSKEVDAELAGLYADLTARELGVPLDENQKTLRDNARTRLLLARDKREKVEAGKKPVADNAADDVQYEQAAKYVDNLLATKGQSGTSLADEYPMLMTLAQDFDRYAPAEVLARAIRQEIMAGTLDPRADEIDMIRTVAPKIENYYDGVAKRIEAARAKKTRPGTTTPSVKPKAVVEASTEQRQSTGARTISNAAASRAPAKLPKTTKQKAQPSEKTRKDFPSNEAWKSYLLDKHSS